MKNWFRKHGFAPNITLSKVTEFEIIFSTSGEFSTQERREVWNFRNLNKSSKRKQTFVKIIEFSNFEGFALEHWISSIYALIIKIETELILVDIYEVLKVC